MTHKEVNKLVVVMWLVVLSLYAGYFTAMATTTKEVVKVSPPMCKPVMSCPAIL